MKRFVLKFFLLVIPIGIACLPIVDYNLRIDPYGVFKIDFSHQGIEPNQHFIKMKFLLAKKIKKDSFIFGSSRVGKINPKANQKTQNYYNMTYTEGVPAENLLDLKILLSNGIKIKNIILGIDNISYLVDPKEHETQTLRMPYPSNPFGLLLTYTKYLILQPSKSLDQEIKKAKEFKVVYDIYDSGVPLVLGKDEWIEEHKEQHISDPKFNEPSWEGYYNERIDKTISELKEMKAICEKNQINLIVFINPMHETTYRKQDFREYSKFLKELAGFTAFFDFSGINKVTSNNYYYYETSHYRPIVGDMILNTIFGQAQRSDFGVFVTKANIGEHIRKLKSELLIKQ